MFTFDVRLFIFQPGATWKINHWTVLCLNLVAAPYMEIMVMEFRRILFLLGAVTILFTCISVCEAETELIGKWKFDRQGAIQWVPDMSYRNCGRRKGEKISGSRLNPLIVGGKQTRSHDWPWMGALFKLVPDQSEEESSSFSWRLKCGATLISRLFLLTAAHCFRQDKDFNMPIDVSLHYVLLGHSNLQLCTRYDVDDVIVHQGYIRPQRYNDIALVRLRTPVILSWKLLPICLNPTRDVMNWADNVTLTGWGNTEDGDSVSKMRSVVVQPVTLDSCNATYWLKDVNALPRGITGSMLCAGTTHGGKDSCQGDSGGPMVQGTPDGIWVQLGVVSLGFGCGEPNVPGAYTRIAYYADWLRDNSDVFRT